MVTVLTNFPLKLEKIDRKLDSNQLNKFNRLDTRPYTRAETRAQGFGRADPPRTPRPLLAMWAGKSPHRPRIETCESNINYPVRKVVYTGPGRRNSATLRTLEARSSTPCISIFLSPPGVKDGELRTVHTSAFTRLRSAGSIARLNAACGTRQDKSAWFWSNGLPAC